MERQPRQSTTTQIPFQQLLKRNDLAIIENPLRRIPESNLPTYIEEFYEQSDLANIVDVDTLIRATRLARDEEAFIDEESAEGTLTKVETTALDKEKSTTIWTESREIKIILLSCCVASIVQGWAQGAIVGANQSWPKDLGLNLGQNVGPTEPENGQIGDIWRFSATNAIVYFAASSIGAFLCDPLTEIFVGRRGAIFVAALFTFAASIGEAFTQSWQALFAWLAVSGAIALIVPHSWRFQISSSFIPALVLLLLVFVGSESPRWLIKKRRYSKAYTVLLRLRENPLLAARDLVFIWAQLQVETTLFMRTDKDVIDLDLKNRIPYLEPKAYLRTIGLSGYARRITQLFTIPRARRATLASFVVMSAQQMSGVNVFAFLASTLFEYGEHQEVGMAWASAVCWTGAGILDLCVPALIHALGQTGLLCLFAGLDAFAFFLVWLLVPGTERQIATMEEMNYVFGVSTRRHVEYQVKEVAPWCVDHYIRLRRGAELDPLYRYARARDQANGTATGSDNGGHAMNGGTTNGNI
ncbi:MAG: hypothetical protein Q9219_007072 [cf. Caloplaca sp. 3 TL-2023]